VICGWEADRSKLARVADLSGPYEKNLSVLFIQSRDLPSINLKVQNEISEPARLEGNKKHPLNRKKPSLAP
jgi:hypothetical protein